MAVFLLLVVAPLYVIGGFLYLVYRGLFGLIVDLVHLVRDAARQ